MKVKINYKEGRDPWEKVDIRIDEEDTWSMDCTLAEIVVPMLIQLRDTTHGYPFDLMHDENIPKDYDNEYDDYDDGKGFERWKVILDKMIFSFTEAKDEYKTPLNQKMSVEAYDIFHKKVQEGFDLFGKYYMNLWD